MKHQEMKSYHVVSLIVSLQMEQRARCFSMELCENGSSTNKNNHSTFCVPSEERKAAQ